MRVHFSAQHPTFGTKYKPKSLSFQQRSPYYWWWAYLRLNQAYLDCCANDGQGEMSNIYKDFGDVSSYDFKTWWDKRGVELFAEKPLPQSLRALTNKSEWDSSWGDNVMVVAVPMNMSKRYIYSRLLYLINKKQTTKRGRSKDAWTNSTAKYKINRNHTIDNLRTAYSVYLDYLENKSRPKGEQLKLWEIGTKLRLVASAMPAKDDIYADNLVKRNVMAASVNRYIKQAKQLIDGVGRGIFPA